MRINRTFIVTLFAPWLILLVCKPVENNNFVNNEPKNGVFRCISSQSQCVITHELGDFSIYFNRDPVITEVDYQIAFKFTQKKAVKGNQAKVEVKKVSAYIEGKNMYMGKIPLNFVKHNELYIADSLLGSCSEDYMEWRLWFIVEFEKKSLENFTVKQQAKQTFYVDFASQRF